MTSRSHRTTELHKSATQREGGLKNCESVVRMLIGIFWGFTMELHADRCNPYLLFIVRTYGVQRLRLEAGSLVDGARDENSCW